MTEPTCKCCGQTLPEPILVEGLVGQERTIVREVWRAGKNGILSNRLLHMIYAGAVDGGPLFASTSMRVRIARLNKGLLAKAGYRIRGQHTGNGAFGRYKLEQINVPHR